MLVLQEIELRLWDPQYHCFSEALGGLFRNNCRWPFQCCTTGMPPQVLLERLSQETDVEETVNEPLSQETNDEEADSHGGTTSPAATPRAASAATPDTAATEHRRSQQERE